MTTLSHGLTKNLASRPLAVQNVALVLTGSWIVALLAQISIPLGFTPVPVTGQTLGVLLVGSALGGRLGLFSLLAYLVQGSIGLPFFAGGTGGMAVFGQPTAGYLFAFPVAAWLVGALAERGWDRSPVRTLLSFALGHCAVFAGGLFWLSFFVPRDQVLLLGLYPFVLGTLIKCLIAAGMLPATWRALARR